MSRLKIERWVSGSRKASLAGRGGGRVENALDRCLTASRLGNRGDTGLSPFSPLPPPVPLSPSQTLLCLLKEMPPTFKDTSAAVW